MQRRLPALLTTALLALGIGALGALGATGSHAAECATALPVTDSVRVIHGSGGTPNADNRGWVANSVLITAPRGVIVVDPGPTPEAGAALHCALQRAQLPAPIALIFTHPHPENILASNAFPGLPVFAAKAAATAMQERCERCRAHLARALGQDGLANVEAMMPDHPISAPTDTELGGLALRLIPLGAAHSPGDLAVFIPAEGVLVGGDVAAIDELPDLRDGTLGAWIVALDMLRALPATLVIPGRGKAVPPAQLARTHAYLDQLQRAADSAVHAWNTHHFLPAAQNASEFRRFDELHPLNSQHALREAEERWWNELPKSAQ